jgi:transposase
MQVETLDTTVRDYINELETRNKELQNKVIEIETSNTQILNEYLILKEQYDLLVYKRFARSAEQLLADKKQPLLFTEEEGQPEANEEKPLGLQKVKSFMKRKGGRKPISASLQRRPRIIDIPESEKICACGAVLTKIGEETSD